MALKLYTVSISLTSTSSIYTDRFVVIGNSIITTCVELNYEGTGQRGSNSTVKGGGSGEDRWGKGKRKDEETRKEVR